MHTEGQNVQAVLDWPTPECGKEVLGFLELSGYYRKFIKRYAHVAMPLYGVSQLKKREFNWSEEYNKAFITLKKRLASSPVLALPTADED